MSLFSLVSDRQYQSLVCSVVAQGLFPSLPEREREREGRGGGGRG